MVALRPIDASEREALRSRLEPYLVELDGSPDYPRLDLYWQEDARLPFWIVDVDTPVGFCLIRRLDGGWSIAEFSIDAERRRRGYGRSAVEALAAAAVADGAKHLRADVLCPNERGLSFWTECGFVPVRSDDEYVTTIRTL